jgi:hypothetical protein
MAQAPFVIQPQLTAITLAYQNARFIADEVLPRVPVQSPSFKWSKFTLADSFTIPDTRVGRKSAPNEIDWTATEETSSVSDYGLDDRIPQADIEAAAAGQRITGVQSLDPRMRSTELLSDLVLLDREKRTADLVFNADTYPSGRKVTLATSGQWSHPDSNPIKALLDALDVPLVRPNKLILGQSVWTTIRLHPRVAAAIFPTGGNATGGGSPVSRQALADVLEIDEVIVGQGWYNSAKPGQAATMARLWGKAAALVYSAPIVASPQSTMTFGFTAQYLTRVAGTIEQDSSVGLRGGERVRVGESVKELVVAADAAYYFADAIA